jgi:putative SOS response-associated peptidase YedK
MCNRFEVDTDRAALALTLEAQLPLLFDWEPAIYPRQTAPGLMLNADEKRDLVPMQFGLAPPGSKTRSDPKRTLNNTRIESFDKWPWKTSFRRYRCIVPLTSFREPCYWGETAGTEVDFTPVKEPVLGAAAVYNVWQSADKSEEVVTMSLLMRPASPYIMEHGHHRMPFFLEKEGYDPWMQVGEREPNDSKSILREYSVEPQLQYSIARHMADSWTKRRSAKLKQRDEQLAEIEKAGQLGF